MAQDQTGVLSKSTGNPYTAVEFNGLNDAINNNAIDSAAQFLKFSSKGAVDIEVEKASDLDAYIVGDAWEFNTDINIFILDAFSFDKGFKNNGFTVNLVKLGFAGGLLTYTGTGSLFRGNGGIFAVTNANIVMTGNGAQLFDMDGAAVVLLDGIQVICDPAGNQSLGVIDNATQAVTFTLATFVGYQTGLNITCTQAVGIRQCSFFSNTIGSSTALRINRASSTITLNSITFGLGAGESCLYIDPDLFGSADMSTLTNMNDFQFYELGATGSISAFVNATLSPASVTSVTDNAGIAVFNHASTDVTEGQEVEMTGFTDPRYNGTFRVISASFGTFETDVTFVAGDSGTFAANSTSVTSTAHGLSELDTVLIEDGADYYGGTTVFNVTANSFQINKTFTVNKTGSWNAGSLDEDDARVNARDVGNQADSRDTASYTFNGNTSPTVITDGVYVDMNLSGIIELDDNMSRFFIQDFANGEIIFAGRRPFRGLISVLIASQNSGAPNADYRITIQRGDVVPDFASAPYMPLALQSQGDQVTLVFPITLQPGERFRPKIAGDGSGSNLIIAHGIVSAS